MVVGRHGNGLEVGALGGDPPVPTLVGGMVNFGRADPRWRYRVVSGLHRYLPGYD